MWQVIPIIGNDMNHGKFVQPIECVYMAMEDVTDELQLVYDDGIELPCFCLRVTNAGNYAVYVSYDGVNYHDYLSADSFFEVNTVLNHQNLNVPHWEKGQKIWLASPDYPYAKPAIGIITISGYSYFNEKGL